MKKYKKFLNSEEQIEEVKAEVREINKKVFVIKENGEKKQLLREQV